MRPPARNTRSARVPTGNDAIAPIKDAHGAQNASHTGQTTASSKKDHRPSGKTKKSRHRMTNQQLDRLEALYQKSTHPSRQAKQELGEQVGMDVRTVTVWFQNRRQIAKKSPDMNVSAPSSVPPRATPHRSTTGSRPPLVIVSHRNLPNGSKTSASVTTMPLYPAPVTILPVGYPFSHPPIQSTQPNQPVQPQDLWKFIPSSPPTSQRDTSISPTTPSTIQASPSVEEEQVPIGKRKRALEWACHRLEKRQRLGKDAHPEEDSGDTTDDESQSDHTQTTCYDPLGLAIQDCKSMEMVERRAYEIPAQYHATFPPDVVLGASLLLTLKHSG